MLKVVTKKDEIENIECKEIDIHNEEEAKKIFTLANNMIPIIQKDGLGLAAIQIGIKEKFMVFLNKDDNFYVAVNPVYYPDNKKKEIMIEGCLSYPNQEYAVRRYKRIRAVFYTITKDKKFQKSTGVLTGTYARVFQHETDHCEGVTIAMVGRRVK
jgi:peptide deformylase